MTRSTATSGRCRASRWDQVYGTVNPAGSATVAILDTGVDASHPDLAGAVVPGKNIITNSGDGTADPNGHGTAMAGIVAASTNNGIGIAGVGYAGVKVMPVTVLDADGTGTDSDVINGIVYARRHGANVILMSFSNPGYSTSLQKAVDYAWSHNVVLVAATGNDGSTTVNYPAGDRSVVGVASTDLERPRRARPATRRRRVPRRPGRGRPLDPDRWRLQRDHRHLRLGGSVAGAAALIRAIVLRRHQRRDRQSSRSQRRPGRQQQPDRQRTPQPRPRNQRQQHHLNSARWRCRERRPVRRPICGGEQELHHHLCWAPGGGSIASSAVTGSPAPAVRDYVLRPRVTTGHLDNTATGTLTVTPTAGSTFGGWSGAFVGGGTTTCAGTTSPCTFSMSNAAQMLTATFNGQATTTSLARTTGSSPSVYGSALTFTATVTGSSSNPSGVGTVTFKDGTTTICNAVALSGNTATCSPTLDVGSYSLTAVYSGGTGFAGLARAPRR